MVSISELGGLDIRNMLQNRIYKSILERIILHFIFYYYHYILYSKTSIMKFFSFSLYSRGIILCQKIH